jgi:probable HAF family extracellular repeat protein
MLSIATLLHVGIAEGQTPYDVTDTGPATLLGCGSGADNLINSSGQVAQTVSATNPDGTISASTFFVTNRIATNIGSLFGYATYARGINVQGTIFGVSATSAQSGTTYHAYRWTPASGIADLAPFNTAEVCGMNSRGDVVGDMATSDGPHAFVAYAGGRTFDLSAYASAELGHSIQFALSINDFGQIFTVGMESGGVPHGFVLTPTGLNLLVDGGFEGYAPPDLGPPGWVSDDLRAVPAKSESNQPHTGTRNGACWATTHQDCGMYQEVTAPANGTYNLVFSANADRAGGLVGVNVNGHTVGYAKVAVNGFGSYGTQIPMTFVANQGDTIRVWMFSPATPGYVVIDDVLLFVNPSP